MIFYYFDVKRTNIWPLQYYTVNLSWYVE